MLVSEFQDRLAAIYGTANADRSWDYEFGYLSRTVGYLSKAAKRDAANTIDVFRPLSWLASVSTKLGVRVEDAFFRRYPAICPYCLEMTCVCRRTKKQPRRELAPYKIVDELRTHYESLLNVQHNPRPEAPIFSFAHAAEVVRILYPANEIVWFHSGPAYHFGKLHEEVAEIHEAAARHEKRGGLTAAVADEVGDVFAWLVSAWDILFPQKDLGDELKGHYLSGCPVCRAVECTCNARGERPDGLISTEALAALLSMVQAVEGRINDARLAGVRRSLQSAIDTQSQPTARAALLQLQAVIAELSASATAISDPEEVKSMLARVLRTVRAAAPFNELGGM